MDDFGFEDLWDDPDQSKEIMRKLGRYPFYQVGWMSKRTPAVFKGFFAWLYAQPRPINEVSGW